MYPLRVTSFRGVVFSTIAACAVAICVSSLPAWAGQQQQSDSTAAVQQNAGPTAGEANTAAPEAVPEPAEPAVPQIPASLTLPAGTILSIRTSQFLSSDQSRPGDAFTAELNQPLVVNGWVVARRGQTVVGRVVTAKKAGLIKGTSQLGIELSRLILVDGQQLPIHTQLMQTSGPTTKGRDAAAVGTTTGIGAAIGATARDAGEGAGIGAAIGAGAGLAGVLLTRGRATVLPPETPLTFELEIPVTFSTAHGQVAFRPATQADYDNQSAPELRRRAERRPAPGYPPPYYYSGYGYPWSPYFWGGPVFLDFGFYRFGGGWRRGGWRR